MFETDEQFERIQEEILDAVDEEIEVDIEDAISDALRPEPAPKKLSRKRYFRELIRLQRELVKLQDWVVATKAKITVLFEGRDAAGKGGVIKRITQRLNPRVCRVAALPAPTEREKSQWYFPALRFSSARRWRNGAVRSKLVQPRRRRAGHGILHR